jgi:tRNA G18 (ribose-2'-O)-methylase SpoU
MLGECGRMSDMKDVVVILPNIRSVHNVASVFRTADGAGVKKIYVCGITPTPFDRLGHIRQDFQKVALGAHESVLWEYVESCDDILNRLKSEGYTICALEQNSKSIPYDQNISLEKIALILGEEVTGIDSGVLSSAHNYR